MCTTFRTYLAEMVILEVFALFIKMHEVYEISFSDHYLGE